MNRLIAVGLMGPLLLAAGARPLQACSICSSVSPTICDQIDAAQLAVIARLDTIPDVNDDTPLHGDRYKAVFRIERVLKGTNELGDERIARALFFPGDSAKPGDFYLVFGNLIPNDADTGTEIKWTSPITVDSHSIRYINTMLELPAKGTERLKFAMPFLTDTAKMLRSDAFNEFANAPYDTLQRLKDLLDPEVLVKGIRAEKTSPEIRKLYFTLLSICGRPDDVPMLEMRIRNYELKQRGSLAAMIACYLSLAGTDGLPLVEATYLSSEDPNDMALAGNAIIALRFHGQEAQVIDREQILEVMRRMFAHPQLAIRVIPDLARWEDWSVLDQVVRLFVEATDDTLFARDKMAAYVMVCPLPEAKQHLKEFEKIDPGAVIKARRHLAFVSQEATRVAAGETDEANSGETADGSIGSTEEAVAAVGTYLPVEDSTSIWSAAWLIYLPVAAGVLFVVLLLVGVKRRRTES